MTTYIVSGYPRTGTSMMMAALHRGGLDAVWNPERDGIRARFGDEHYDTNRMGMYELTPRELAQDGFPRMYEGKLIKVLYNVLPHLVVGDYRGVFMRRPWEDVVASYERYFKCWPKRQFHSDAEFQHWQDEFVGIARVRSDMEVVEAQFGSVKNDPRSVFKRLALHGWPIDVEAAVSAVEEYELVPHGAGL